MAEGTLENLIELSAEGARSRQGRISQANRRRSTAGMPCDFVPLQSRCLQLLCSFFAAKKQLPLTTGGKGSSSWSVPGRESPSPGREKERRNSKQMENIDWISVSYYSAPHPWQRQIGFPADSGANRADGRLGASRKDRPQRDRPVPTFQLGRPHFNTPSPIRKDRLYDRLITFSNTLRNR